MCVKSFLTRKQCNIRRCFLYSIPVVIGVGDLFDKVIYRKRTGKPCSAACRQGMVGACIIVTKCLGAISAKENRACILDLIKICKGVIHANFQMLGRYAIGNLNALDQIGTNYDFSEIINGRTSDRFTGQCRKLLFNLSLYSEREFLAICHKHSTCHFIVLSLGEQICCHESRIGFAVGEYKDLGRTCNHIDCYFSIYLTLCLSNKSITGTYDFVNTGNRLGSICKCSNCLSTTDFENLIHACYFSCTKNCGIDLAILLRRRDHYDFTNSRKFCRDAVHQHG